MTALQALLIADTRRDRHQQQGTRCKVDDDDDDSGGSKFPDEDDGEEDDGGGGVR